MYTRSYESENERMNIPENYNGNAFFEEKSTASDSAEKEPLRAPWDDAPKEDIEAMAKAEPREIFGGYFKSLPFANIFDSFGFGKKMKFGTEELLIIGIALFLLFSKSGDKECALMMLFLLFVN